MQNFTVEKIIIGNKIIDEITDTDGIKWYPLKQFLERILCKFDKVSTFRDSTISKYMQVIEYPVSSLFPDKNMPTWCINILGVKYLLKHMTIMNKGNNRLYKAREKGFAEACCYFNIKIPTKIDPTFIQTTPDLSNYDIWSVLCLEYDYNIKPNTIWKKCPECGYYYPDFDSYYGARKIKSTPCLQCQQRDFKCKNKVIQYIYENNGIDLLYKLHENNEDNKIVNELKKFIARGGKFDESEHS